MTNENRNETKNIVFNCFNKLRNAKKREKMSTFVKNKKKMTYV